MFVPKLAFPSFWCICVSRPCSRNTCVAMLCAFIHCMTCHFIPIGLEKWDSACLHCPSCFQDDKRKNLVVWFGQPRRSHETGSLVSAPESSDSSSVKAVWTVSAEVGLTIRETRTQNFGFPSTSLTWPPEWSFKSSVLICHIFFRSFQICPCSAKCKQLGKPTRHCRKCITCTSPSSPCPSAPETQRVAIGVGSTELDFCLSL